MSATRSRFALYMAAQPAVVNEKFDFEWQLIHDSALPEESHVADAKLTREISAAAALSFTLYPGGHAWPKTEEGTYELAAEPIKTYLMVAWLDPYMKWGEADGVWDTDIAWCDTISDASNTNGEIVFVGRVDSVEVSMGNDGLLSANVTAVETVDEMDEQTGWGIGYSSIKYLNTYTTPTKGDSSIKIAFSTGEDYDLPLRTGGCALNPITKCFPIITTDTSIGSYEFARAANDEEFPNYVTLKERFDEFVERYGLEWEQIYYGKSEALPDIDSSLLMARISIHPSAYVNPAFDTLTVRLGWNLESYSITTSNDGIATVRVPYFGRFNVGADGKQRSVAPITSDVWSAYADNSSKYKCHQGFLQAYSSMKSKYDVVLAWPSTMTTENTDAYITGLVSPSAVAAYGASLEFYNAGNVLGLSESSYTTSVEWQDALIDACANKTVSAWATFWQEAIEAYVAQLEPTTTIDVSGYDMTMTYGGYGNPPHLFQQCKVIDTITGKTYAQRIEGYTVRFDEPWKYDLILGSIPQRISR